MKITYKALWTLLFIPVFLALSACGAPTDDSAATATATAASPDTTLVQSADGSVSISVPNAWNTNDTTLYPYAAIGVSDEVNDQHGVVLKRSKADLTPGTTLSDYLNLCKEVFSTMLTDPVWSEPSEITLGGLEGINLHLSGVSKKDEASLVYSINILEDDENFYQMDCWTTQDNEKANQQTLDDIIKSFHIS